MDKFILDNNEDVARKQYEELEWKHDHVGGSADFGFYTIYLDQMADLYPLFNNGQEAPYFHLLETTRESKHFNQVKYNEFWKRTDDDIEANKKWRRERGITHRIDYTFWEKIKDAFGLM